MDEIKWGWLQDGGEHCEGPFDTREAAIEDARQNLRDNEVAEETIILGRCRFADPGVHMLDVDDIAEQMEQNAYDNDYGFWDDEIFEVTCPNEGVTHDHKACIKKRDEELVAWARRWFRSSVWTLDEVERVELKREPCPTCEGSGDGHDLGDRGVQACDTCHGSGKV